MRLLGLHPDTRNVLQLGIGFFFVFLAFNSQGFIEESVLDSFVPSGRVTKHSGYTSLCLIYAYFTVFNFVAPFLIKLLGTRCSLVFGGCCYVLFLAGFLFVHQWFLYISSILLGLGAAVIWTAQGKYLTLNSTEQSAGKHSSLFLALSQVCLSCGGLLLLAVFLLTSSSENVNANNSNSYVMESAFSEFTVWILYGSFAVIASVGVLVLAFLPAAKQPEAAKDETTTNLAQIKSIFRTAATTKMAALSLSCVYTGIVLSFWSSIFPTSIINTMQFRRQFNPKVLIALNGIIKGFGQPLLSLCFRCFHLQRFRPSWLVLCGLCIHFVAFALCFLNLPNFAPLGQTAESAVINSNVWIALCCGFLLSFGDACWNTQIFAFLITNYPNRSAEAFALFKFYQSLLTSLLFFLSGYLLLYWHLLILCIFAVAGFIGFVIAERIDDGDNKWNEKDDNSNNKEISTL